MDQYRRRPKLSENFEGHWSIMRVMILKRMVLLLPTTTPDTTPTLEILLTSQRGPRRAPGQKCGKSAPQLGVPEKAPKNCRKNVPRPFL